MTRAALALLALGCSPAFIEPRPRPHAPSTALERSLLPLVAQTDTGCSGIAVGPHLVATVTHCSASRVELTLISGIRCQSRLLNCGAGVLPATGYSGEALLEGVCLLETECRLERWALLRRIRGAAPIAMVDRNWQVTNALASQEGTVLCVDAPSVPGQSGAGVFLLTGELAGLNVAGFPDGNTFGVGADHIAELL